VSVWYAGASRMVSASMPQTLREENLQSRFDAVSLKSLQLQQAVRVGNDDLVRLLDRELDTLIGDVVDYRAEDSREIHLQLRFIGGLIREDADDRTCVVRHSAILAILLDRYFGAERLVDNERAKLAPAVSLVGGDDEMVLNESILNSIPDRLAVVTADCRYLYVNPPYASYRRETALDLVGRHLSEFMGVEAFETSARKRIEQCFAGDTVDFDYWNTDGANPCLIHVRATPLRGSAGRVIGAVIMLRDVALTVDHLAA